jgi:hypothetical protein
MHRSTQKDSYKFYFVFFEVSMNFYKFWKLELIYGINKEIMKFKNRKGGHSVGPHPDHGHSLANYWPTVLARPKRS